MSSQKSFNRSQTCYQDLREELETKTKTLVTWSRDQDQDLGHQVSRPRPRPWPSGLETKTLVPGLETKTKTLVPGLETKTKTLVIRSRGQDLIIRHKYLCMCIYACMYVCIYVCIYVCMHAFVYVAYVGRPIKIII